MNTKRIQVILVVSIVFLILLIVGIFAVRQVAPAPAVTPTEELSVAVSREPVEIGPRIIRQSPITGARLGLDPVIELTFDRDMDQGKTASAWTFHEAEGLILPGTITWLDARTLQFKPIRTLEPAAKYFATLTTEAAGLDGSSPAADIRLDFQTADALAVGQVFPASGAQDVEGNTTITVIFNRPVVPVTIVEEQAAQTQPITISPDLAGMGEWVSSSVYVFTPEKNLANGTQYTVRVPAGMEDVSGGRLPEEYSWQFTTRAPQIWWFELKNGAVNPDTNIENVLLDQAFIVHFLQAMDPASVSQAISLVNRETSRPFPFRQKWNTDNTVLTIEPTGRYAVGSFYRLSLTESAQASAGGTLKEGLELYFSTVPLPSVKEVDPTPGTTLDRYQSWIRISFSAPMNFASLKNRIKILPAPAKELNWSYNEYDWSVNLYGLEPGKQYVVRLLAGMSDIYGHTINRDYAFSFKNGDRSPYGRLLAPGGPMVYRAQGPQNYFFEYINLASADITLYRLSSNEFRDFETGATVLENYLPTTDLVREWKPELQAEQNSLARIQIALEDQAGTPLEPGYYFLGLKMSPSQTESTYAQGVLFIVATDNITFKATDSEALAWLVDLETGKPTPNVPVTFYDDQFLTLGHATTDKDGLVYLKDVSNPAYVRTDSTDRVAFASLSWGSGVSASDFGIWQQYYQKTGTEFVYVYTERPLYRPGQDVYFTGVVRSEDDLYYTLPDEKRVYVTINNWQEEVSAQYLSLSAAGSFTGTYSLGDDLPLGDYEIQVRNGPKEDLVGSVSFRVAEYRKPEFQVSISQDKADILGGDKVNFALDAAYYSGGSVSNAGVEWFVESAPFFFNPPSAYAQYSFEDWDRDAYWSSPQTTGNELLAQGQATTGADGRLNLAQTIAPGKTKTSRTISLSVNVTDVAGNLVSGGTQLVMHQSLYYAGIRPEGYVGQAGEEQTFDLAVLDWNGQPVPRQAVSVDIALRNWYSVQEQDEQGQLSWVTTVKDVPAASFSRVVTDGDGKASVTFIPREGGIYRALVTVRDSKGNSQKASAFLWVSSDSYVSWRQTNDRSFSLIADKDTYNPGETADILIAQPFAGESYALVTYERGHIYQREVVLLQGNSTVYHLPITKEMAPMAYVSVVVVGGADALGTPDFKVGIARINVDTSQQTLEVRITSDKTAAGPGDEVTYTVETKDAQGKPASAEVSFALVDKAILALVPSNVPALLEAFYPKRALSVVTSVGIVQDAEDFLANYKETPPTGEGSGSGGGGKGSGDLGIVTVRQDFKDTAFFQSQVMTDGQGRAQVKVTLPENLTTWHMDVRAVTEDSRVGQAVHELVSTKPLFLQIQTPRFFVAGDSARIGAAVHNNTTSPLEVRVSLEVKETLEDAAAQNSYAVEQTVTVPAKQQAYVTWDVAVLPGATRVDLTARAVSGKYADATKPSLGTLPDQGIPVYSYSVKETVGTSGMLTAANSTTEAFQLPLNLDGRNAQLQVEVSPSLAASIVDGLTYLRDYPYLCLEQTVSRFLPNVLATRVLQNAGRSLPISQADLENEISVALQKIYSHQNDDGGWAWWDGYSSDLQTSAYVVLGLLEAGESGISVKESVLSNGTDYLANNLPTLSANDPTWQFNRQAFVLYVLARDGNFQDAEFLYENRQMLGVYGKAFLMQAMALEDPADTRVDTILSDLSTDAVLSAAGAHWEEETDDYWNWNTDTRTTAIVLNALLQVDPKNALAPSAVRWLMVSRTEGRWASTQETAWSLMALTNWLVASNELRAEYSYAVGLNGDLVMIGDVNRFNLTDPSHGVVDLDSSLADKVNYLVITRGNGPGNLYYSAYLETDLPVASVEALDRGMIVSRQYFSLGDSKKPVTEIGRGELVRVRLTVVAPNAVHYVVINDPLPAGLEALDASLSTNAAVPDVYTRSDFDERGWGWWYFSHADVRDEKIVLSSDYLPPGTYVYTYLARASTAGTFNVIPATAEEFYFPDVGGRSAGSKFVVTP